MGYIPKSPREVAEELEKIQEPLDPSEKGYATEEEMSKAMRGESDLETGVADVTDVEPEEEPGDDGDPLPREGREPDAKELDEE